MTGSLRTIPSFFLTGILPFGAIFVELYFIMTSLWTNKIYYMFGFLFLCYGLMIMTAAATTVLLTYFLLCAENYRWQWRSFAGAGMTGGYVFINALIFWGTRVSFGGVTGAVLYVGYSALIGFVVAILTGKRSIARVERHRLTEQGRLDSLPAGRLCTGSTGRSRWTRVYRVVIVLCSLYVVVYLKCIQAMPSINHLVWTSSCCSPRLHLFVSPSSLDLCFLPLR